MKNGYKINWSQHALNELDAIIEFLNIYWTEKELSRFSNELEKTLAIISSNPFIFQESQSQKEVRRAVILSLNSLYYRIKNDNIEIISIYANRKKPIY